MELAKINGTPAQRSIALDYRTELPGWNCVVALRHKYWLLSGLMIMTLILSLIPSLAAHLIIVKSVDTIETANLDVITMFNASLLTANTDLRLVLDLVLLTRIYGATPPPWTDGRYAFPNLSLFPSNDVYNITVDINATAVDLDCRKLDETDYTMSFQYQEGIGKLLVHANDRGCSISSMLAISKRTPLYLRTFVEPPCATGGGSRFGLVSGQYSAEFPTLLANSSFLSCIPQYWMFPGRLYLSVEPGGMPRIRAFSCNKATATQIQPDYGMGFDATL